MDALDSLLLYLYTYKDEIEIFKDILLSSVAIIGLFFLGIRAIAQNRSSKAAITQSKSANKQAESSNRQASISEKGHITDRFVKAIDQLGATNNSGRPILEIRLGAIYGLEKLTIDSEDLRSPILEVLTAYVRTNSLDIGEVNQEKNSDQSKLKIARSDVQAALTVLGRRQNPKIEDQLDLSYSKLNGFRLSGDFSGSSLYSTDLSGAMLTNVELKEANLNSATIEEAYIFKASFDKSELIQANLSRSKIAFTSFRETNLEFIDFSDTILTMIEMDGSNLESANLTNTVFYRTNANNCSFEKTNLTRCIFRRSHLDSSSFKDSILNETDLSGAFLDNTRFENVDLRRAKYHEPDFKKSILKNVILDEG